MLCFKVSGAALATPITPIIQYGEPSFRVAIRV